MSKISEARADGVAMVMMNFDADKRFAAADEANSAMETAKATGVEAGAWLREQFSRDLVFGVWYDPAEPFGIAVAALKGQGRLKLISQGTRPKQMTVAHIRCTSAEEAEAMCLTFGDGRNRQA